MALWGRSVARLGAERTMPYVYLEPVSAVLLAALVLGESPGWSAAAGGVLALAGVWLTERTRSA
ncbi:MAG TPA: EamA family transporter [Thermodesulfobacteriota bacterium]